MINKAENVTLRRDVVTFFGTLLECRNMVECIGTLLKRRESHRPKRVLLFMNPISGWKDSVRQYRTLVQPIFTLCGVIAHDIETRYANHARDVLSDYCLNAIDAVITMGGDGSVKQVVNGLMERAASDAGVDMDGSNARVVKPAVAVGVIPCGSGNATSLMANMSRDLETAVLNIVLGHRLQADITTVYNGVKFLAYSTVAQSIGLLATCMASFEKLRWMAKLRYTLFPPMIWWKWQIFDCQIEYKPVPAEECEFHLQPMSQKCSKPPPDLHSTTDGPEPGWKTLRGPSLDVSVMPWAMVDSSKYFQNREPRYRTPNMSSGKLFVVLYKNAGYFSVMKSVGEVSKHGRQCIPAYIAQQMEVSECRVRVIDAQNHGLGIISIDGDTVHLPNGPDVHMTIHQNSLDILGINDEMVMEAKMFV